MADLKISQLPAGSVPAGANIFPVVQSGTTNQVTIAQLFTSPSLVTPALGTPASGTLTNCTLPVGGVTGLGTGVATALAVNVGSAGAPVVNGGALGTPASGTLTNCTLPVGGVSGLGTGVATALAVNVGSAGAPVVNGGALGTPSSGTLTSCTGLPIATGVSGLGADVATFLATPSSANLAAAVTGETGSGALVFGTGPTISAPVLKIKAYTVDAGADQLPAAASNLGMVAYVTDATAPAIGSVVAGSGAAVAMVWSNGTDWTVTGV